MTDPRIDDPTFRMTTHDRVVLVWAIPPPSPGAVQHLETALRRSARQHGKAGLLIAYDFSRFRGPLPDSEMRSRMAALLREVPLFGMAVVVDRRGFFGSAIRSMVTGVLMIARPSFRVRVFGDADEACAWLALQSERPPLDASALSAALRELRAGSP